MIEDLDLIDSTLALYSPNRILYLQRLHEAWQIAVWLRFSSTTPSPREWISFRASLRVRVTANAYAAPVGETRLPTEPKRPHLLLCHLT